MFAIGSSPAACSFGATERTVAVAPSPDQTLLACWTSARLHVVSCRDSQIESVAQLDPDAANPGVAAGNVGDVEGFRAVLWRPSGIAANAAGTTGTTTSSKGEGGTTGSSTTSTPTTSTSASTLPAGASLLALCAPRHIVIVRLADANKEKKSTGWLEWLLSDAGEGESGEGEGEGEGATVTNEDGTTTSASTSSSSTTPAWKLKVVGTIAAEAGSSFSSAACTRSGLLLGTSDGSIMCATWTGEVVLVADPRAHAATIVPTSSTSPSSSSKRPAVSVLAASSEGLVIAGYSDGSLVGFEASSSSSLATRFRVPAETIALLAPPSTASSCAPCSAACALSPSGGAGAHVAAVGLADGTVQVFAATRIAAPVAVAVADSSSITTSSSASSTDTPRGPSYEWVRVTRLPADSVDCDDSATPIVGAARGSGAAHAGSPHATTALAFRQLIPSNAPQHACRGAGVYLAAGVATSTGPLVSVWSFPVVNDASVSLLYSHRLSGGGAEAEAAGGAPRASLAWTGAGSFLFVATGREVGDAGFASSSPGLVRIEFADSASEAARSGACSSGEAGAGRWALSSTNLYYLSVKHTAGIVAETAPPPVNIASGSAAWARGSRAGSEGPGAAGAAAAAASSSSTSTTTASSSMTTPRKSRVGAAGALIAGTPSGKSSGPSFALTGARPCAPPELGDVDVSWTSIPPSPFYMPSSAPLRCAATTSDGNRIAVAGTRGIAVYNTRRDAWHVFSRPREEKQVCVRAMCWLMDRVLLVAHQAPVSPSSSPSPASQGGKGGSTTPAPEIRLQAYTHAHLDFDSRLFDVPLVLPPGHSIVAMSTGTSTVSPAPSGAPDANEAALAAAGKATSKKGKPSGPALPSIIPWLAIASQDQGMEVIPAGGVGSGRGGGQVTISLFRISLSGAKEEVPKPVAPSKIDATLVEVAAAAKNNKAPPFPSAFSSPAGTSSPLSSAPEEGEASGSGSASTVPAGSILVASSLKANAGTGAVSIIPEEVVIRPIVKAARPELLATFTLPFTVCSASDALVSLSIVSSRSEETDTIPAESRMLTLQGVLAAADAASIPKRNRPRSLPSAAAPYLWSLFYPEIALRTASGSVFILDGKKGQVRHLLGLRAADPYAPVPDPCSGMWTVPASAYGFTGAAAEATSVLIAFAGPSVFFYVPQTAYFPSNMDPSIPAEALGDGKKEAGGEEEDEGEKKKEKKEKKAMSSPKESQSVLPTLLSPFPSLPGSLLQAHAPFSATATARVVGLLPQEGACAIVASSGARIVAGVGEAGDASSASSASASLSSPHSSASTARSGRTAPSGLSLVPTLPALLQALCFSSAGGGHAQSSSSTTILEGDSLEVVAAATRRLVESGAADVRTGLRSFLVEALDAEAAAASSSSAGVSRRMEVGGASFDLHTACSPSAGVVLRTLAGALRTYMKSKGFAAADVAALLPPGSIAQEAVTEGASSSASSSSSFSTRSPQLSAALSFLRSVGTFVFLDTVSAVGRTMDEEGIPLLFPAAGLPRELLREAIAAAVASTSVGGRLTPDSVRFLRVAAATMLLAQEYAWRKQVAGSSAASAIVTESLADAASVLSAAGLPAALVEELTAAPGEGEGETSAAAAAGASSDETLPEDLLIRVRGALVSLCDGGVVEMSALLHLAETTRAYSRRLRRAAAEQAREAKADSALGKKLVGKGAGSSKLAAVALPPMANAKKNAAGEAEASTTPIPPTEAAPAPTPAPAAEAASGWSFFRAAAAFIGIGDSPAAVPEPTIDTSATSSAAVAAGSSPKGVGVAVAIASPRARSDPILQLLLSTKIGLLGRYTAVACRRADGTFPFTVAPADGHMGLSSLCAEGSAGASSSSSSDLVAVKKAAADIVAVQDKWLKAQLLDLTAIIGSVESSSSAGAGSLPALAAGDVLLRVEGKSLAGEGMAEVNETMETAPRNAKVVCIRPVAMSALQVLLGMFDVRSE